MQVISGIALAGLAEGFALADRIGVMLKDLVEILGITNLNCPFLKDKAETIINDKFQECQYPLQYMQRDMRLALQLADSLQQPLLMTSTANEIYKHARRLGYDKHDDSSIFMRVRYWVRISLLVECYYVLVDSVQWVFSACISISMV